MKSTLIIAFAAILLVSCKKEEAVRVPEDSSIYGRWIWVKSTGGFAGDTITPQSSGQSMTWILERDLSFTEIRNGNPEAKGTFAFKAGSSSTSNTNAFLTIYSSRVINGATVSDTIRYVFTAGKDSFGVYPDGWADAYGMTFKKVFYGED